VRTRVRAGGGWWPLQEFMIRRRGEGPIDDIDFRHVRAAAPTPEVLAALDAARAIIIGPSNPVISIGPILALDGVVQAVRDSPAPVVAVSPLVGGRVLKGPTEACLHWAGQPVSSAGVAALYGGIIDGLVADEPTAGVAVLQTDVLMPDAAGRRRLAEAALGFALSGLS
jgi:LPPG:FO 2-phospho-L-lactate transferase